MIDGALNSHPGSALPKSRMERSGPLGRGGASVSLMALMRGDDDVVLWFLGDVFFVPAAPIVVIDVGRISILEVIACARVDAGFLASLVSLPSLASVVGGFGAGGGIKSLRKGLGDSGIELDSL